ncbi:MAG: hypothetical protein JW748_05680 [Anaerolineales bacterium]|nr:hypothetical protein [Anaerolineales bacterium]
MKKKTFVALWIAPVAVLLAGCAVPSTTEPPVPQDTQPIASAIPNPASDLPPAVGKLHWFGTSSILCHGSKNIHFAPVALDPRC